MHFCIVCGESVWTLFSCHKSYMLCPRVWIELPTVCECDLVWLVVQTYGLCSRMCVCVYRSDEARRMWEWFGSIYFKEICLHALSIIMFPLINNNLCKLDKHFELRVF